MHGSEVELGFLGILTNHKMVYDDDENDDGGVSSGANSTCRRQLKGERRSEHS